MSGNDGFVIETERMILRRFSMEDTGLLYELNSNPEVLRYLSRRGPSWEEVEEALQDYIVQYSRELSPGRLAALDRASGRFIGQFSLHQHGGIRELSMGYRLMPECWGRGLATEGAKALIGYGFAMPDVERIRAQTMFVNAGSRRVMEKCGLRYIRTFHEQFDDPLPGTELGEVEYAITRREWLVVSRLHW